MELAEMTIEQLQVLRTQVEQEHQELLAKRHAINEMLAQREAELMLRSPLGVQRLGR